MDRLSQNDIDALHRLCPGGLAQGVDLSAISQWRIGGPADIILRPSSTGEVAALRHWFAKRGIRTLVIGLTTNMLFADAGLRVPCIQIGNRMKKVSVEGTDVQAQAGVWVPGLARRLMHEGLTGAEHTSGIPGTLGGLIFMNGGSLRQSISTNVVSVESVDAQGRVDVHLATECEFSYRHSVFQHNDRIITGATLRFNSANRSEIRMKILEILSSRRRKFPRKEPNCGSTFVSDPELYAEYGPPGAIIERLGFKGFRIGGAKVSEVHANFIVNTGGARASDVLAVLGAINASAKRVLGRPLRAEVRYVNQNGNISPASEIAAQRDFEIV